MMGDIAACLELTEALLSEFHKEQPRDTLIQNVHRLLDRRGALLAAMKPPFSCESQLLGRKIMDLDKQLKPLMQETLSGIRSDIQEA
ncbi:hypothetical protein WNX13_10355, partial [Lactobacillus delbrueckii]|uniref:hypothetical protein n=1 Tax=Lactobacillus delbrueckii TaxID=1584 RepID=UPI0030E9450E